MGHISRASTRAFAMLGWRKMRDALRPFASLAQLAKIARLRRLAPAALLAAAFAAPVSCSAPAIPSDDFGAALPERARTVPTDGGADRGRADTPRPPVDASSNAASDAAPDAAVEAASQAVLCSAPDLVLCFGFEDAVVDGSPNALAPAVTGVSFTAGKHGRAAVFDARSAMRFGASSAFQVTTATIEAWVKPAANRPGDGVIFDADDRASLTILQDGTVLCKPSGAKSSAKLAPDAWSHVACVFDDGDVRVYVNGLEVDSDGGRIGSSPAAGAAVGGNSPSGEPFVGAIDSLRVFRVARTPTQIAIAAAP